MKKIFKESFLEPSNGLMIVGSNFNQELDQLIKLRDQYRNVIESDFDETFKQNIALEFHEKIFSLGLEQEKDIFINSEYKCFPEQTIDAILLATVWTWAENQQISININQFLNSLKVELQTLRSKRGHIGLNDIDRLIQVHSVQSVASKIIKEIYQNQVINSSQILSVLGDTQEAILKPLEDKLNFTDELIKKGEYKEALDIYKSLVTFYPKEEIFLQCAALNEMCKKFEEAVKYSNSVLSINSLNYAANFIKGTSLGALKRYTEAVQQLEYALTIKRTPELYYNLAHIFWLNNDNQNAINNYKLCLELNNSFSSAHLNISICYFENMDLEMSLYHVNQAILIEPNMYQAYARKGELYRFLGLYDDAIHYFEECLLRDKANYQALLGISLSFVEKGCLSEGIIHFKNFFYHYYDQFFNSNDTVGKKVGIIDIGKNGTSLTTIELAGENQLNIYVKETCLPVSIQKRNDFIFLGALELSDHTGSALYPAIGKVYENQQQFKSVLEQIKKSVDLFQFFDQQLYIDMDNNIDVNLTEREKYVLIEITFNNKYHITGITNEKSGGLESFLDNLEKCGQFRIHLECFESKEVFVIDGLKDINISLFTKEH